MVSWYYNYLVSPAEQNKRLKRAYSASILFRSLCDNKCAESIALDTIKPKRTKSIDMRFHWIRDRIKQQQFVVAWRKGADNLADFFTKPLPVHAHQSLMPLLVHTPPAFHLSFSPPQLSGQLNGQTIRQKEFPFQPPCVHAQHRGPSSWASLYRPSHYTAADRGIYLAAGTPYYPAAKTPLTYWGFEPRASGL